MWSLTNLSEQLEIELGGDTLLRRHLWCLDDHQWLGAEESEMKTEESEMKTIVCKYKHALYTCACMILDYKAKLRRSVASANENNTDYKNKWIWEILALHPISLEKYSLLPLISHIQLVF